MVQNPTPTCRISVSSSAAAVPDKMKDQSTVYPKVKVKVREEKDPDDHPAAYEQKRNYLLSLKDLESLFLEDSYNSPGKEHRVPPSTTAKIPKDYIPNVIEPSTSESQERMCKTVDVVDEDNNVNTRACSIPMPRAVVSSPENDIMIGKKNRKTTEKPSVLKNHNSVQSRHAQCKIIASHSGNENPITARKSKDAVDNKRRQVGMSGTVSRGSSFMSKRTR